MDSEARVAVSESEIMDLLKAVHERNQTRISSGLVLLHSVFAAVAVFAFACVVVMRLCGVLDSSIVHKYVFACVTSVMFFAVGTFMVEYMRNDLFAGTLGRLLAACGLFVMSAQGYEFMQKSRLSELNMELMANQAKAKPVEYQPVSYLREAEHNGFKVSWESEHSDGRSRPVFSAGRCSTTGDVGITAKGGSVHCVPGRTSGTAPNGTSAVY